MHESCTDHTSNSQSLSESSVFIFFQFCRKINWTQSEKVVKAIYGQLTPQLILRNIEFKIWKKNPRDTAFRVLFKFSRCEWDLRIANFNRFLHDSLPVTIESFISRELGLLLDWRFRFLISFIPWHILNEVCLFSLKAFSKCDFSGEVRFVIYIHFILLVELIFLF